MKRSSNLIAGGVIAALVLGAVFAVSMAFARTPLQAASTGTPAAAGTGTGTAQATGTQQAQPTPLPPNYVRVWTSMCVEGVPYTLLSVPPDTKFALIQEPVAGAVTPGATLTAIANMPAASSGTGTPQANSATGTPQASTSGTGTAQAGAGTSVPVTGENNSLGMVPSENSCTALGTVSGQQLVMCTGPQASTYSIFVHGSNGTQTYKGQLWDCGVKPIPQHGGASGGPTGLTPVPVMTDTPAATLPATPQPGATATP